jgi:hypothetical protein
MKSCPVPGRGRMKFAGNKCQMDDAPLQLVNESSSESPQRFRAPDKPLNHLQHLAVESGATRLPAPRTKNVYGRPKEVFGLVAPPILHRIQMRKDKSA